MYWSYNAVSCYEESRTMTLPRYTRKLQESSMIKMVFIIDPCRPHIEIIKRFEIETEKHELVYFWSGSLQETFLLCLFWQAELF